MDNFTFLQNYQELQKDVMYNEIIDLGFAKVGFCEIEKSFFWNNAIVDKILNNDELHLINKTLKTKSRNSAIYFEHKEKLQPLIAFLENNEYKKRAEDSWMFYGGNDVNLSGLNKIKKVENENDLNIFIDTFDKCYQKDDPQNPYGTLGDYLKITKDVWYKHHKSNRLEYFMAYKGDQPVAVASLNNYNNIGYILNVGSLREVRGEGFGKFATLYCVKVSKDRGNTVHCLATEENTYPNEFYERIGFNTRFTGCCYVLDK